MRLKDHLNKLEYFLIVAKEGSLKKASQKAFIGQPQLTKVIQQLEDIVGLPLLVRSVKGVNLTKEGVLLQEYAQKILKNAEEAEFRIKSGDQSLKGEVNIGTYDSIARYFFPEFLKYLKVAMPDIKIQLQTGRSNGLLKLIEKGHIDISVNVAVERTKKSIAVEKIYTDSFALYRAPHLDPQFEDNLIYFPFPMNETEKTMGRYGFKQSFRCDNMETVRNLAEQSLGVGLLPHRVAKESVLNKKLELCNNPRLKSKSFDEHDIVLCFSKKENDQAKDYVIKEIRRFLELWYSR